MIPCRLREICGQATIGVEEAPARGGHVPEAPNRGTHALPTDRLRLPHHNIQKL